MILRNLEDGWDYQPDWRAAVVEQTLAERPAATLAQLCGEEPDRVIRHALQFKKTGQGASSKVFGYCYRCHAARTSNIASAIIRSMTVAGFSTEEIAKRLNTALFNVVVYQRLFFDVGRYRGNREWMGSIVAPHSPVNARDPIAIKEAMLLAAALHGGKPGLRQLLEGTVPTTPEEIEAMASAIRGALTMRAHQFALQSLHTGLGPDDLAKYIELMRLPAVKDTSGQHTRMNAFHMELIDLLDRKSAEAAKKTAPVQTAGSREPASVSPFSSS